MPKPNKQDSLENRLKSLDQRLQKSDIGNAKSQRPKTDNVNFANAIRLSTEFVVAILVGIGIGWTIDRVFGTAPWAMIIFLPLGFVAGVRSIMRAAGLQSGQKMNEPEEEQADKQAEE